MLQSVHEVAFHLSQVEAEFAYTLELILV